MAGIADALCHTQPWFYSGMTKSKYLYAPERILRRLVPVILLPGCRGSCYFLFYILVRLFLNGIFGWTTATAFSNHLYLQNDTTISYLS